MARWEPAPRRGCVYLIHFHNRISPKHTCQHYIGFAYDVAKRLREHRNGTGARLCQVAIERGIDFEVVRRWEGGRDLEKRLKAKHSGPRLCPVCNAGGDGDLEF